MARDGRKRSFCAFACVACIVVGVSVASPLAAGLPDMLFNALNNPITIPNGDFVSSDGGLTQAYRYFIEVPPGTPELAIDVFDGDVGGVNWDIGAAPVSYNLFDPNGVAAGTVFMAAGTNAFRDNVWTRLFRIATPIPGHWRLDHDFTLGGGGSLNGYRIQAHDGSTGGPGPNPATAANPAVAGGIELNLYAQSYLNTGVVTDLGITPFVSFPYVTSGCVFDSNEWDGDGATSLTVTSRSGGFSATNPVSAASAWSNIAYTGWTAPTQALDYGTWTLTWVIGNFRNWITYYFGDFTAASAPPTAQPEAGALRVYLGTDAGARPPKAFLSQVMTAITGPNPPAPGMTTRVGIEIFVTNPEPFPISFGGAELVRATIPGGTAVYAGLGEVSQGTVTTQPAIGGSGAFTWDPGTVPANSFASVEYRVDVTPAAGCPVTAVTGAPGSGTGTRASWIDNTCASAAPACTGTQLAGATFASGELCTMTIDCSLLTYTSIHDVQVGVDGGRPVVSWRTAGEVGTRAFRVLRHAPDGTVRAAHADVLSSLEQTAQGGRYQFVDETAPAVSAGDTVTYSLVEIDARAREEAFGPYAREVEPSDGIAPPRAAWQAVPHAATDPPKARRPNVRGAAGASVVHIGVDETGMVTVAASVIADRLETTEAEILRRIAAGTLSLVDPEGDDIAWTSSPGGDAIVFFGQALDTPYTVENVYRLQRGPGVVMAAVAGGDPSPSAGTPTFAATTEVGDDVFAAIGLPLDPEGDYWFARALQAGHPTNSRVVTTLDAQTAEPSQGSAVLEVDLLGANTQGLVDEHHVQIFLDGNLVADRSFEGIGSETVSVTLPAGTISSGLNDVEIVALLDPGIPASFVYLNRATLSYPHRFEARNERLAFRGDGHSAVAVDGFATPPQIFDLGDPMRPKRVQATVTGTGPYGFAIAPTPGVSYLAIATTGEVEPAFVRGAVPSDWSDPGLAADLVIIAADGLEVAAQRLADHRDAGGLAALVVPLRDVFDEFAGGIADPWAIRRFLEHAVGNWNVAPRYVVLAGGGHWDYQDRLGLGTPSLPPVLASTPEGLFSADNQLVDFDQDGRPELAIGRLPVVDGAALDAVIDKILAWEAEAADTWLGRQTLLADAPDGGTRFADAFPDVAGKLPNHYEVGTIDAGLLPLADARQDLIDALGQGQAFVDYHGHGAVDRLGSGLLTVADVATLANGPTMPVLSAMTCTANRFEVPGFQALGTALVNQADGGAIAVWSPSGLSVVSGASRLATRFYHAVFQGNTERLGDAVLHALSGFTPPADGEAMPAVYTLLGDPSLPLRRWSPPTPDLQPPTLEDDVFPTGFAPECDLGQIEIAAGDSAIVPCRVIAFGGFAGTVDLVTSLPGGWTGGPVPASVELAGDGSVDVDLVLDVPPGTPPGPVTVSLDADDGQSSTGTRVEVDVVPASDLPFFDGFESGDTAAWSVTISP